MSYLSTPLLSFRMYEWKERNLMGGSHDFKYVSSNGCKIKQMHTNECKRTDRNTCILKIQISIFRLYAYDDGVFTLIHWRILRFPLSNDLEKVTPIGEHKRSKRSRVDNPLFWSISNNLAETIHTFVNEIHT